MAKDMAGGDHSGHSGKAASGRGGSARRDGERHGGNNGRAASQGERDGRPDRRQKPRNQDRSRKKPGNKEWSGSYQNRYRSTFHSERGPEKSPGTGKRKEKAARSYPAGQREWPDRPVGEGRSRSREDERNNGVILLGSVKNEH